MTDDERVDYLLERLDSGEAWEELDALTDADTIALRDLTWAALVRLRSNALPDVDTLAQIIRRRTGEPPGWSTKLAKGILAEIGGAS